MVSPVAADPAKLRPNDPCWCGSGQKYKRCHRVATDGSARAGCARCALSRPTSPARPTPPTASRACVETIP